MSVTAEIAVAVDLDPLDAMIARFALIPAVIAKYAALVEAEAKRLAPVDTGTLRDEIHTELAALAADIVSDMPYSAAQEYGTARQPGHAYMRPALERLAPAFVAELQALIGG